MSGGIMDESNFVLIPNSRLLVFWIHGATNVDDYISTVTFGVIISSVESCQQDILSLYRHVWMLDGTSSLVKLAVISSVLSLDSALPYS